MKLIQIRYVQHNIYKIIQTSHHFEWKITFSRDRELEKNSNFSTRINNTKSKCQSFCRTCTLPKIVRSNIENYDISKKTVEHFIWKMQIFIPLSKTAIYFRLVEQINLKKTENILHPFVGFGFFTSSNNFSISNFLQFQDLHCRLPLHHPNRKKDHALHINEANFIHIWTNQHIVKSIHTTSTLFFYLNNRTHLICIIER